MGIAGQGSELLSSFLNYQKQELPHTMYLADLLVIWVHYISLKNWRTKNIFRPTGSEENFKNIEMLKH